MELLNKEIRRLKKIEEGEKKSSISQNTIVCGKRKSKRNKTWSPNHPSTSSKNVKMNKKIKKVLIPLIKTRISVLVIIVVYIQLQ